MPVTFSSQIFSSYQSLTYLALWPSLLRASISLVYDGNIGNFWLSNVKSILSISIFFISQMNTDISRQTISNYCVNTPMKIQKINTRIRLAISICFASYLVLLFHFVKYMRFLILEILKKNSMIKSKKIQWLL